MAVQRRERAGKVRWVGRYRDATGREHSKTFDREKAAKKWVGDREKEVRDGTWVPPDVATMTLAAWCETWYSGRTGIAPATLEQYRTIIDTDITPALGQIPVRALTTSRCRTWVRDLTETRSWRQPIVEEIDGKKVARPDVLAASTASTRAHVLASILKEAVQEGVLVRSPMAGVKPPKRAVETTAVDPDVLPTGAELWALHAAAPDLIKEAIIVAAGTGLRQGELLGLRRRSVDFLRKEIVVLEQAVTLTRGGAEFRPPKTRQALRRLPVGDVVIDAIARHLERYPCEPDEAIFRNRMGRLHRRSAFGDLWRLARREAGARDTLRWHELRHFYASTLIAGGASVREVMERMGHTSAEETIARYSRLWPDREETTRAIVDAALSRGTDAGPVALKSV
ncbi:tyrosine-type recombinase/integrase [Dietzia maris]|uniref:Tyrosine-type recombinase/integrase n=1 Tax=Dietzia maris TaxID=37915 RepID=A0AAE4TZT3_9ACTN|nr:tyrosine-type recombinase/integrase [Dietzia maris]MDV6300240.1 tyrosine-type recombinase/integrase [Dietzia maris]